MTIPVPEEIERSQQADGGWSLIGPGSTTNARCAASDGYPTGLVVLVMNFADIGKIDTSLLRGTHWPETNQPEDGMWATVSATYNSPARGEREDDLTIMGSGFCAAPLSVANQRSR